MKKVLCGTVLLFSLTAQAETGFERYRAESGFDFYMGASLWYTNAQGGIDAPSINYTLELEEPDINKNYNGGFFTALEHPVSWLPDVLVSYNTVKHEGRGTLAFNSLTYPIEGAIDLSHTDVTFYYNVLDGMGFIDLGITARVFSGELSLSLLGNSSVSDLSTTLPLVYLQTGMNLPLPGLSVGLTLNSGKRSKDQSADGSLYMQYETPYGLGVSGGYRYMNTDIASKGELGTITIDVNADFDIYGPFLSMYYHL